MEKKYTRNLAILFFTYFLACLGWNFVNSVLIFYGREVLGINVAAMSAVGGIIGFVSLCIRPFSGFISDRINAKKLYVVSLVLVAAISVGFVFSRELFHLKILQAIRAVAWTFLNVSGQYMVGRMYADKKIGKAVTIFMIGGSFAGMISGSPVLWVVNTLGHRGSFNFSAVFNLLAVAIACLLDFKEDEEYKVKRTLNLSAENFFNVKILHIAILAFVYQTMDIAYGSGFIFDFARNELSIENVGLFVTVAGIAGIVGRMLYAEIYDRKGFLFTIICYTVGDLISTFALMSASAYSHFMVAAVFIGLFSTGSAAILQAEAVKKSGKDKIGVATSTRCIGNDIGFMFGSVIMGALAESMGTYRNSYRFMFFVNLIAFIALIVMMAVNKRKKISA